VTDCELGDRSLDSGQGTGFFSSPKLPKQLWSQPSLLFNGCRKLFGQRQRGWGVKLTIHLHLVVTIRVSGAVSAPPIRHHGVSANKFTLSIIIIIIIVIAWGQI
jgi:hypothetical protein